MYSVVYTPVLGITTNKKLYNIIESGRFKGERIYDETQIDPVTAFYSELEFYFNACVQNNYHVYIIYNKPKHSIIFNKDEINYISLKSYLHENEEINYNFSDNIT